MIWFILGQLVVYAVVWATAVLIEPQLGSTFLPWLFGLRILGDFLVAPLLDTKLAKHIADGLRSGRISRWSPFSGGAIGATFWVGATIITWWICAPFKSFVAIMIAVILTFVWAAIGVAGSLAYVAELARPIPTGSQPEDVA